MGSENWETRVSRGYERIRHFNWFEFEDLWSQVINVCVNKQLFAKIDSIDCQNIFASDEELEDIDADVTFQIHSFLN